MTQREEPPSDELVRTIEKDLGPPDSNSPEREPMSLEGHSLAAIGVGLLLTDRQGKITYLNPAAEQLTGWALRQARGRPMLDVFPLTTDEDEAPGEDLLFLQRRDGRRVAVRHAVSPRYQDGRVVGTSVVFRDVTPQRLMELKLAHAARTDALTGLLNRTALGQRVEAALRGQSIGDTRDSLCYLDIDPYDLVNATCGHEAGDQLLQWVAARLREGLSSNDAAAHIGGGRFAILLSGREPTDAERLVRDLQRRLREFRFGWDDKTFQVDSSVGIAEVHPRIGGSGDILSAASTACASAKQHGGGRVHRYRLDDAETARRRGAMDWLASIQQHLASGRVILVGQRIEPISARRGRLHCEVLMRTLDEKGQPTSPGSIIQAAEQHGLMDTIDRWVVDSTLRTLGNLPPSALRNIGTCAINLSGVSLGSESLLDFIVERLDRYKVPPGKLCFEITETAALAHLGQVLWYMQELGAMGCRFAIDDFGSGNASYNYLRDLPVDYLKIDGTFVRDLSDDRLQRAIVESIQGISRVLGVRTVAEWVENERTVDTLREIGVDFGQGFHFGRPETLSVLCGGAG